MQTQGKHARQGAEPYGCNEDDAHDQLRHRPQGIEQHPGNTEHKGVRRRIARCNEGHHQREHHCDGRTGDAHRQGVDQGANPASIARKVWRHGLACQGRDGGQPVQQRGGIEQPHVPAGQQHHSEYNRHLPQLAPPTEAEASKDVLALLCRQRLHVVMSRHIGAHIVAKSRPSSDPILRITS